VEIDEAAFRRRLLVLHGRLDADDGAAVALDPSFERAAAALERRLGVFLRLAEHFAAEDDGRVGRHLHREAIVAHVFLVPRLHIEAGAGERMADVAAAPVPEHDRSHWLLGRFEAWRQHVADDLGSCEILDGEQLRAQETRLRESSLDAGDLFVGLHKGHCRISSC
jgi:hypothetical protein